MDSQENSATGCARDELNRQVCGRPSASERLVSMKDACDPTTFNAVLGPGACVRSGGVRFDKFIAALQRRGEVGAWHFAPSTTTAHRGRDSRPAGNRRIPVLSQQNNVPYESDQKNDPEQKNYAGHLEIRVLKDALCPAHPLQCPAILNHHDKQRPGHTLCSGDFVCRYGCAPSSYTRWSHIEDMLLS